MKSAESRAGQTAGGRFLRGSCGLKFNGISGKVHALVSLSTRKLWIEIVNLQSKKIVPVRRFLRGSCGLKLCRLHQYQYQNTSLSTRKLWIEIINSIICFSRSTMSLSTRKLWIEISMGGTLYKQHHSRFLRGSCGLKFVRLLERGGKKSRFLRGSCGLK